MKNKVLYLNSAFKVKELPSAEESIDSIYIEGYASTNDVDRAGDVVPAPVWEAGMENYLKNPVILAYHEHDEPVGRMVEHKIDSNGLWIKARISAAAKIFNLVKDGVLTAFSVGFRINDAEYNSAAEVFVVKELELIEISVVSVPANQNTLFSLSKAFENAEEYKQFKLQFAPKGESAKGLESTTEANSTSHKEWNMDPKELQEMLAKAAKSAAEEATKSLLAAQEAEKAAVQAAKAEQDALEAKIKSTVEATVKTLDTGAERLLEEVTKRLEEQTSESKNVLKGLEEAIKEKADELAKIQASKMTFADKSAANGDISYADKEKAVLLSKVSRKALEDTKFGKQLLEKAGARVPAGAVSSPNSVWELEVSLTMEEEVRRRLVAAPLMRQINMQTNVMRIPVNPEAGEATWVANADFGNANNNSSGTTVTHALKEVTLSAYKVATREYMAFEEEEDSILILLPVVRDAMIRRVAKAVDKAFLIGTGANAASPVKGLANYDATPLQIATTAKVTVANLRQLRRELGTWGLEPDLLRYIVSQDAYYDLLDDDDFLTVDKVGNQATILTGQVGLIGNTPVVVAGMLPAKGEDAPGVIAVHPGNFIVGNQRGLRIDTDDLVERQSRVLVASLRTGMTQVTTNEGQGVATLTYSDTP